MREFMGPQNRLAGFAFEAGQLLFAKAHGALALGQQLHLLAACLHARPAQHVHALRQRQASNRPTNRIGLTEHIQASAPRLRQRLPARLLLLLACGDPLLQSFESPPLGEILRLQCPQRLGVRLEFGLTFGHQLGASSLDGT